jgi:hypothetical protein
MRILVCGGRDFNDSVFLYKYLDKMHAEQPIEEVIEGGAIGADTIARNWAMDRGVNVTTYWANWNKHGNAAGPIRNKRMLVQGDPDVVVAFPGGRGTANMMAQALGANIRVIIPKPET